MIAFTLAASLAIADVDNQTLLSWGIEVNDEIDRTLRAGQTSLYVETAAIDGSQFGGFNERAFVWPIGTQFRVLNSLVRMDSASYAQQLRQFTDQMHTAYWDDGYRSGAGGGTRFYDDNAHIVVAYAEAYRLTGNTGYLRRAIDTYDFVLEGEDARGGGGIYFNEEFFDSKDSISTLQGARGAAMLYDATGDPKYLGDAERLLTWAKSFVQLPSGTFDQGYDLINETGNGPDIVNASGIGISAFLEMHHVTGDIAYLREAERIGAATLNRFVNRDTTTLTDEGQWAFELIDAYNDLYLSVGDPRWRLLSHRTAEYLHGNMADPNGRYGVFWGRNGPQEGVLSSWNLIDQASVAHAYLDTAMAILPGDIDQDGVLSALDIHAFEEGWQSDTLDENYVGKLQLGDLNTDGLTDIEDFGLFQSAMGGAGIAIPQDTLVRLGLDAPHTGDFNFDGVVDAADYTIWRDNVGSADDSALRGAGDGSGKVDEGDYRLWRDSFGVTRDAGLAITSIPEPPTAAIVLMLISSSRTLPVFQRGSR